MQDCKLDVSESTLSKLFVHVSDGLELVTRYLTLSYGRESSLPL